ncbi:chalcone isomerase family protein [Comamonas jiangduensis]|uniref:chalcone isomerase family protein n=1 Tax=Comamonas jiangduensis TaxID=1194168 RepID=UPI00289FA2D3|nr:chalcone isomerase family protein [Comamonas jiangduensis]
MLKHRIYSLKCVLLQWSVACAVWGAVPTGVAHATPETAPSAAVQQAVLQPRLAGQGQMRFLGLRIYDALLWVGPEFDAQAFGQHRLALELIYHRAFTGQAIAQRSVQEMQRQRRLGEELAHRWTQELAQWLPDVQPGDKLTGLYLPGQGMQLWRGGQPLGTVNDPELARYFFGIWLSPQTSEPGLRSALLAGLGRVAP